MLSNSVPSSVFLTEQRRISTPLRRHSQFESTIRRGDVHSLFTPSQCPYHVAPAGFLRNQFAHGRSLLAPPSPTHDRDAVPAETPKELRLLVVEDDDSTRRLFKIVAQRAARYSDVVVLNDGEQALAWINGIVSGHGGELPDIIVSDLKMPLVDGAVLTAMLKASPRTSHIPVVVITTSELPEDRLRVTEARADGFYVKMAHVPALTDFFRSLPEMHPPHRTQPT